MGRKRDGREGQVRLLEGSARPFRTARKMARPGPRPRDFGPQRRRAAHQAKRIGGRYIGGRNADRPVAPRRARALTLVRKIGSAHVLTPVTNAHLVCRLLLAKKNTQNT